MAFLRIAPAGPEESGSGADRASADIVVVEG
jgi:hypothetical protein